jgi:hypothetical protein
LSATGVSVSFSQGKSYSEAERQVVRDQLERMLAHPFFSHSKRYPTLLRYVVEHTLDGRTEQMKERTLGIEVFGRNPEYDTNQDPVVRTTAGEIRKRIAQYYHLPEHQTDVRIELPIGTYIPEFHIPEPAEAPVKAVLAPPRAAPASRPPLVSLSLPVMIGVLGAVIVVVILVACLAIWVRKPPAPTALDRFWAPVAESSNPVLLCVGQPSTRDIPGDPRPADTTGGAAAPPAAQGDLASQATLREMYRMAKHYVALTDAITLSRIAGMLETRGKTFRVRGLSSTSLADLRDGPVVLVGAFNNEWTLRLTGPLRFSFQNQRPLFWIMDSQNPKANSWRVDNNEPYLQVTDDFGIISRVRDPITGRVVVVAAGLSGWGTEAAGEFLADPKYLEEAVKNAPKDWERKNMQVVIATKVIAGNSGPPSVVATHFW